MFSGALEALCEASSDVFSGEFGEKFHGVFGRMFGKLSGKVSCGEGGHPTGHMAKGSGCGGVMLNEALYQVNEALCLYVYTIFTPIQFTYFIMYF